jgi:hypothetical protein
MPRELTGGNILMNDFISEDDLLIFERWLKHRQGIHVPTSLPPEELREYREFFDEWMARRTSSPKVGLMKLQRRPGEQKYAVAIRDGSDRLWLTMWVSCKRKGDIIILYPRAGSDAGNPHASYHRDGTFHQKSHDVKQLPQKRQPLTAAFSGSEHLGLYGGHGTSTGADCDPKAFDGLVIVEPRVLGRLNGSVGIDLVEPGYELEWSRDDMGQCFYFRGIHQREVFPRNGRPSVVITIQR